MPGHRLPEAGRGRCGERRAGRRVRRRAAHLRAALDAGDDEPGSQGAFRDTRRRKVVSRGPAGRREGRAADLSASARRLSEILLESIAALAGAGETEAACRLAGQACVALKATDPAAARRFDVLLHRLTPKL